jgi:hypothetical protein
MQMVSKLNEQDKHLLDGERRKSRLLSADVLGQSEVDELLRGVVGPCPEVSDTSDDMHRTLFCIGEDDWAEAMANLSGNANGDDTTTSGETSGCDYHTHSQDRDAVLRSTLKYYLDKHREAVVEAAKQEALVQAYSDIVDKLKRVIIGQ